MEPAQPIRQFLLGRATPRPPAGADPAQTAYLVIWQSRPTRQDRLCLADLLQADQATWPTTGSLVVARLGLLSAWSAKALDILAIARLAKVRHLERATYHPDGTPRCDPLLERILTSKHIHAWGNDGATHTAGTAAQDVLAALDASGRTRLQVSLDGLRRQPTQAEILLVAQAGSDHCRHVTFNTPWPHLASPTTLMDTIRATHARHPHGTLVAYSDNAAVIAADGRRTFGIQDDGCWGTNPASGAIIHTVVKGETHNHPTGLAPWPGAATGVGGEIRDEAVTGHGAASHAGCAGYMVSLPHLLGEAPPPTWPRHLANPLQVLLEAPLGATAFANEFGRPTLAGFCRIFEQHLHGQHLGFHKPVMFAAGMGEILADSLVRHAPQAGDLVVALGGPAMLVGMGGGSAASCPGHAAAVTSVQRDNAEMQRRLQEVIERCRLGADNPLRGIHDIGAGGLGTALAELTLPPGCKVDLDQVPTAQDGMDAAELLVNEAQERCLALVQPGDLARLQDYCERERCPLAVIGKLTASGLLDIQQAGQACVSLASPTMLGPTALPGREAHLPQPRPRQATRPGKHGLGQSCHAVLAHPAVADKSFLVTIADRGVGGLTARDQLVGPWQVNVADCAATRLDQRTHRGRVMACGERPAVAAHDPAAGARIAIAEALTNLAAANVGSLANVKLALNWMGNCATPADCGALVAAVRGACEPFLQDLGLAVPVGKDSLAMRTSWQDAAGNAHEVSAPTTCVATAFAHTADVRQILTPQLSGRHDTFLLRLSSATGQCLGASALAQAHDLVGNDVADVTAAGMRAWWATMQALHAEGLVLAYHDISDGGMLAAVCEMCFAANCGATLVLDSLCQPAMGMDAEGYEQSADTLAPGSHARIAVELFSEQPGALIEVSHADAARVLELAATHGLPAGPHSVGWPVRERQLKILRNATAVVAESLDTLRDSWTQWARTIRARRDYPAAAAEEAAAQPGLQPGLHATPHVPPLIRSGQQPAALVLRDQGTNGHVEMAAALDAAGFTVRMATVTEVALGLQDLDGALLALPGGFAHGDVLGAGAGTAAAFLHNPVLGDALAAFLRRDTLVLGVCNGCQVFARLAEFLPRRCAFPNFTPNRSGRFECRLAQVEVLPCSSPFLATLAGLRLPVPVACGEGLAKFPRPSPAAVPAQPALRFVRADGLAATTHPHNPTGTPDGLCGFATPDGQVTLLMPHPERATETAGLSWCPPSWRGQHTPWHDFFVNARNHLAS